MAEETKRELVFLVADKGMEAMIGAFLGREDFHHRLGCSRFDFNPKTDIVKATGHDPGLVKREAATINLRRGEYRRAIVVVDNAYDNSPGPDKIREKIASQLDGFWEQFKVIVIDPELENWFWVDNSGLLKEVLLWTAKGGDRTPKDVLEEAGLWQAGASKPGDPKLAVEYLYRQGYTKDATNGIFKRLALALPSVRGCTDESFRLLMATIAEWFPAAEGRATTTYAVTTADNTEQTEHSQ
ncbi:methylation-associated defense system protein MAD4 [Streptomyces sp. NPDC056785]|uniref:methylation-associated defense system protein MAD4 n=1 Tax=Streptomyces sp. NPDC056785 TaxID=3345944 RepID=UPI00368581E9